MKTASIYGLDEEDLWSIAKHNNARRFWSKVSVQSNGCWLWTLGKDKDGYGKFSVSLGHQRERHVRAHRLSWELWFGPSPAHLVMKHSCDTPACVNPFHVSPGTQTANRAECVSKRRHAFGTSHPNAKLNEGIVLDIRRRRASGESLPSISARYGISSGHICLIVSRRIWSHVA